MSVNLTAIGASGIEAAEAEIATIEANITNASNTNYSAETVNLAPIAGEVGEGAGVTVLGTVRSEAPFLDTTINDTEATAGANAAIAQVVALAQNTIEPGSGTDLGTDLQNIFNAFTNLAASPTDTTVGNAAINAAAQFALDAQNVSAGLATTATNDLAGLSAVVGEVNQVSGQIAQINQQITAAQATGSTAPALLDQRDALVNQLAGLIGASADGNGNVTVGGVPLVTGGTALTLSTSGSGVSVGLQVSLASGSLPLQVSQVGGTIGGMLSGAASAVQLQGQVNDFVTAAATAINTQNEAGYGLDGAPGAAIFQIPGASGGPIALNSTLTTQNLGAAASAAGVPGDGTNANAIAALANSSGLDADFPGSTLAQAFGQITSDFGFTVQNATNGQQQATASLQSLNALKSSVTGVSLNDQLANLVEYQNMLQAAGQAVQAAGNMTTFLIQQLDQPGV